MNHPPLPGQHWPEQHGHYAGLSAAVDDHAAPGHLVLLDALPPGTNKLTWQQATDWAASLGDGARLPTRFEAALLYANLEKKVAKDDWYWTSTQYSAHLAWFCGFYDGNQYGYRKSYEGSAVAVRRLTLESFSPLGAA